MGRTLIYCLKVCFSAAVTAPIIYLLFTQSLNLNDIFTLRWLGFTLLADLAIALPASVILNQLIKVFSKNNISTRRQKFFLSIASMLLCFVAILISCGWIAAVTVYYKLAVTCSVISVVFVWVYPLEIV